jgi:iron complex transport system ATP-binding protein
MDCRVYPPASLLSLTGVCVKLGALRFGPFTFEVIPGERIAILGPSGAGKSTLLKMLSRQLPFFSGEAALNGRALSHWSVSDLSRQRAVLPQSYEVAFGLPTDLVIGLGRVARMHDPKLADIIRLSAELACAVHLLGRRFDTLSGGEKARIQLARVFAQLWDVEQGMVLVDEPLASLDPGLQFQLMDAIESFAAQRGHAVLAVLHDINHALLGFERLLLVKHGKLVADLPSTTNAIPHLESLYNVTLSCATCATGEMVVTPIRGRQAIEALV